MNVINYLNQNKIVPRCLDCKHCIIPGLITGEDIYSTAKCAKVIYQSQDTGKIKLEYAYIARSNDKMCGLSGKNFTPLLRKEN